MAEKGSHSYQSEVQFLRRAQEAIQRRLLSFLCRCPCPLGGPVDSPSMMDGGCVQCQQELAHWGWQGLSLLVRGELWVQYEWE